MHQIEASESSWRIAPTFRHGMLNEESKLVSLDIVPHLQETSNSNDAKSKIPFDSLRKVAKIPSLNDISVALDEHIFPRSKMVSKWNYIEKKKCFESLRRIARYPSLKNGLLTLDEHIFPRSKKLSVVCRANTSVDSTKLVKTPLLMDCAAILEVESTTAVGYSSPNLVISDPIMMAKSPSLEDSDESFEFI